MNKLFKWIGAFVSAIGVLGIPVLFALCYVYSWWNMFGPFLVFTLLDVIVLTIGLYMFAEYLDNNF